MCKYLLTKYKFSATSNVRSSTFSLWPTHNLQPTVHSIYYLQNTIESKNLTCAYLYEFRLIEIKDLIINIYHTVTYDFLRLMQLCTDSSIDMCMYAFPKSFTYSAFAFRLPNLAVSLFRFCRILPFYHSHRSGAYFGVCKRYVPWQPSSLVVTACLFYLF